MLSGQPKPLASTSGASKPTGTLNVNLPPTSGDAAISTKEIVGLAKAAADKSICQQLREYGRVVDTVPGDGNCLFESVARQLGRSHTHRTLRQLTYVTAMRYQHMFEPFVIGGSAVYIRDINQLSCDGVWNIQVADMAIIILQYALQVRIAVIRDYTRSYFFPDDGGEVVDDNTVVVIQDRSRTHYDATRLVGKSKSL